MEEASVAGESPDRSKQRESSAEPAPGSAVPVPEARSAEREEARDPRLAVAREDAAPGRGGVDTATRVFSVKDLKGTGASGGEGTDAPGGSAADDDRPAPAAEAVAAPAEAEDAPEAKSAPATAKDTPADAESASKGRSAPAAAAEDAPEAKSTTGAAKDTPTDAEDAPKGRSAPAAAKPAPGAKDTPADAENAPEGKSATAAAAEDAPEAKSTTGAAKDTPTDAGNGPEGKSAPAAAKDTPADAEDAPEGESATGGEGTSKAAPAAGSGSRTGTDDDADSDDADSDSDEPAGDTDADAGPASGAEPVDQPTTMLKVGRPGKPSVDQPTTMLKVGGAATPAPGKQRDGERAGERESERTSKFVALKPLDDPAARKPQAQPADATAAIPQVGPERTTQQPLPPKPPLDLLAELTNTPPPPQTPLRTAVRRIKIWTPLVLLLVIVFAIVQAVRPLPTPTLVLSAKETYSFEGDKLSLPWPSEGQGWMDVDGIGSMDHFGKQTPVAIGSVAKTMTAYLILRDHPLKPGQEGPKIEVDATAEKEGGYYKDGESTLHTVKAGDFLTEKQALSAVMIPSANNIARLLARWDAGSEAAFVKKMNAAAKELGMTNTTYTDPSGLKETTVSTAEDQVKLGRAVVRIPALVAITSQASWTDPSGHYWSNYNELPLLIGAIGIKTGSTTAAGGNLLFASRKEAGGKTVTIVGAILGQQKPTILKTVNDASKAALLAAEAAVTSTKILKKGDVVGYVDDRLGGRTPVVVTQDVTAVGWSGLRVRLSFAPGDVPHTAKAGTQVGTLTVGDGSNGAVKVPVALQKDLAEPGFADRLTRVA
jgi:D-alanyl-D-alanine carboxypeptidase